MLAKTTDNVLPMESVSRPNTGRHLGAILMDEGKLSAADAEQVLKRQRELGWRFGEAAIELNFITDTDLRAALAKQYEFPYLISGPEGVSKERSPSPAPARARAAASSPPTWRWCSRSSASARS